MEDAIRQTDLAKSEERHQLAWYEAKVWPNLPVCPEEWLMVSTMIIKVNSLTGHNNELKQAVVGMKVGVNNSLNSDILISESDIFIPSAQLLISFGH